MKPKKVYYIPTSGIISGSKRRRNHADSKAITDAAAEGAEYIPVIGKIASGAIKIGAKIASVASGVKDDRYNRTKDSVIKILNAAGYKNEAPAPTLAKFKATAKDAPDKAKTMEPMFKKLQAFVQAILNYYNAGLGDKFVAEAPFRMINLGSIDGASLKYLEELVTVYPPNGSYKPTFEQKARAQVQSGLNQQNTSGAPIIRSSDIEDENIKVLKPYAPVMASTLREAGYVPENSVSGLADQFYSNIVAPASSTTYESDHLDDAITNSILEFMATVQQKKIAGEPMNPVYDKLATLSLNLQERLGNQIKKQAGNSLGNWIMEHPIESLAISVLAGLLISKLIK